ncbi:hypothetical protein Hanom_Chr13g01230081 [Helianthus anomalus]
MHYTMFLALVVLPSIVEFFVRDNVCISFLAPARQSPRPARNYCCRDLYIFLVPAHCSPRPARNYCCRDLYIFLVK